MQGQDYKNHVRWDPTFHFVAMPLALIGLVGMVVHLIQRPSWLSVLFVIATLALLLTVAKLRTYATRLQDRVVRMEENFRHFVLTGAPLDPALTMDQIIGLRFAGDEEFAALCARALSEHLSKDDIKKAVQKWRPDTHRV